MGTYQDRRQFHEKDYIFYPEFWKERVLIPLSVQSFSHAHKGVRPDHFHSDIQVWIFEGYRLYSGLSDV